MKRLGLLTAVFMLSCFAFFSCEGAIDAPAVPENDARQLETPFIGLDSIFVEKIGPIVWNGESDKAAAQDTAKVQNMNRKNASGIKITSNAQSDDFPGIYFIWDSKQKDSGYLKVSAYLFNVLENFILTTKETNTYWDYVIALFEGQELTADNCYVFFLSGADNNKNINMVFIDEWKVKEIIDDPIIDDPIIDEPVIDEPIPTQSNTISAGYSFSAVIKADGSLWAWGQNSYGQLGDGTTTNKSGHVRVGADSDWASAATGSEHTIAIKTDGSLWAWGRNNRGQLGIGTTIDSSAPVRIGTDNDWALLTAGSDYNFAIKKDSTLWGWGYNSSGQLGSGTKTNSLSPVQVGTDTGWITVAASNGNSLGIKADGSLWGWGNNINGQLGDGTTKAKIVPERIGTDDDWAVLAKGNGYTLALKKDGSLWAWGSNSSGQLGDGTTKSKTAPVRVGTDNDWTFVVTKGAGGAKALKEDGSLWAWGPNSNGTVGDGTTINRLAPVQIGIGSIWTEVSSGNNHAIARKADGSLWIWGAGIGSLPAEISPVIEPKFSYGDGYAFQNPIYYNTRIFNTDNWPASNAIVVSTYKKFQELFSMMTAAVINHPYPNVVLSKYYNEAYFDNYQLLAFAYGLASPGYWLEIEDLIYDNGVLTVSTNDLYGGEASVTVTSSCLVIIEIEKIPADTVINIERTGNRGTHLGSEDPRLVSPGCFKVTKQ